MLGNSKKAALKKITIQKNRYNDLKNNKQFLENLKNAGIDDWEGVQYATEYFNLTIGEVLQRELQDTIEIDGDEFVDLIRDDHFIECLYMHRIDDWEGYDKFIYGVGKNEDG